MSTRDQPRRRPRVQVSLTATTRVSTTAESVRSRLCNGAQTVAVNTGEQVITLDDQTFAGAGHRWTVKLIGQSQVRLHCTTPLPETAQIVATDSVAVEVTGCAQIYAYTTATVTAFDDALVIARNRVQVSVCDRARVRAADTVHVRAYDTAYVRAGDQSCVEATDNATLALYDQATAMVTRGVIVRGPSRGNITVAHQ